MLEQQGKLCNMIINYITYLRVPMSSPKDSGHVFRQLSSNSLKSQNKVRVHINPLFSTKMDQCYWTSWLHQN